MTNTNRDRLFPTDLPASQWVEFQAAGFSQPVCGVIFRPDRPPCCGMPLGGVATGCLDIDVRGVLGFSNLFHIGYMEASFSWFAGNIFKSPLTRRTPDYPPFLGLSVGEQAWVLASRAILDGGRLGTCADPVFVGQTGSPIELPQVSGVAAADDIHYWGHYPVVDIEYDLDGGSAAGTAAPVSVGLRAWAPFIPGDLETSNTPAAFFEVHLRNLTQAPQQGTLAFSFPGPVPPDMEDEAQRQRQLRRFIREFKEKHGREPTKRDLSQGFRPESAPEFARHPFTSGRLRAIEVRDGRNSYVLGALDQQEVRFGGELARDGPAWRDMVKGLPPAGRGVPGSSVAVDFRLEAGATARIVFVLAWHSLEWQGADDHFYTPMYATRFGAAREVAERIVPQAENLLRRVLAWQQAIYADTSLPPWLRDALINNLALIPETSYWAVAKPPLGDWCYRGGFFGMLESPRGCPQIECIPCTWYGNLPIVFFFPELARSTLEGYRHYMREDGAVPFVIGRWGRPDMATPSYDWQISLNGPCYVHLVDRLWQRTGDDAVLRDFYPSVKRNTLMTMNLRPTPAGVISMPADNRGMEWFEWGEWAGMCSHLGGIRLATVLIAERMAEAMGDTEFVHQCRQWFANGGQAMEEKMWADGYYLNFYEEETGKKSGVVMGYQLDGEWAARLHGVASVYRADRIPMVLDTIRRCNMQGVVCGALSFATPEGGSLGAEDEVAEYGTHAMFLPEVMILGMNYLYAGQREFGLAFIQRAMEEMICVQRHPWDLPNMILGDTGRRHFGTDYYQNMMLWAAPAALAGQDIRASCASGSLIARVIQINQ